MKKINWQTIRDNKKYWIIGILLVLFVVEAIIIGNYLHKKQEATKTTLPTYKVVSVATPTPLTISARVVATKDQELVPTSGQIKKVVVKNGAYVSAGTIVATTKNDAKSQAAVNLQEQAQKLSDQVSNQQDAVSAAESAVSAAKSALAKAKAKQVLASAKNTLSSLEADQKQAQSQASKAENAATGTVTAPYAGYVMVDQTKTGQPTVAITAKDLEATATVSEYDYQYAQAAAKNALVTIDAASVKEKTALNYLAPTATAVKNGVAQYKLTAALKVVSGMVAGQSATLSLSLTGVKIPASSIVMFKGQSYVYVVKSGVAKRTKVTFTKVGKMYIVPKGLAAGTNVVQTPDKSLIKVAQEKVASHD